MLSPKHHQLLLPTEMSEFSKTDMLQGGTQTAWVHLSGIGRVWNDFSHILGSLVACSLELLLRVWMFIPFSL